MTEDEQPQQRLERLAQQQLEAVAGSFATCWEVVVFGIHYKMLDADDLQEAKEALERGHGYGSEEIGFEPREEEVSPDIWEKRCRLVRMYLKT